MSITPETVKQLLVSEEFGDRLRGVNQLRYLEPSVAFELVKPILVDRNTRVRYAAVSQLSSLGKGKDPDELQSLLIDLLNNDPEFDVRAVAADTLGALKLTDAFEHLREAYYATNEWLLRFSIVAALGELGNPQAFDLLVEALRSENELERLAAIGSLGELGDERAVPLLLPFSSSPDWQIRYRTAQAIGHFSGPDVQATLQILAQDPVAQIADHARASLQTQ